jgi:glucose-1-phosphate adenylyltransferase
MDHVGSGRFYNLARKNGGLIILPPYSAADSGALFNNRLEALLGIITFIRRSKAEYVVMSDCDNVCNINYAEVLDFHSRNGADITLVYREKKVKKYVKSRMILKVNEMGRVGSINITDTGSGKVCVYGDMSVMKRDFLLRLLESAAANGYKSFSKDILVGGLGNMKVYGYKFEGYYASIDNLANYYKHTLQMLDKSNRDSLFDKSNPIYTKSRDSAPTRYIEGSHVKNSFIADGCIIEGIVENSVLSRGVNIKPGAVIKNSILMQATEVGSGANLDCVITDKNVVIRDKRKLSGCEDLPYYVPKGSVL